MYLGKTGNELCPVIAVAAYLAVRDRQPGPFFHFASGSPLSRELFVKHIREALRPHNLEVSSYSGHSFRTGAATAASEAGVEDSMIKTLGRWQSSAYQTHVRIPQESLAAVSKKLSEVRCTLLDYVSVVFIRMMLNEFCYKRCSLKRG